MSVWRRIFKSSGHLRLSNYEWLLVHQHGDYEYRNPDSVYVHRYNTFKTREEAIDYLDNSVPRVDRAEWRLYQWAGTPSEDTE